MRILINTASTYRGGGLQVARSVVEEATHCTRHQYRVVLGASLSKLIASQPLPHLSYTALNYRPAERLLRLRSADQDLKRIEQDFQPDVVFTTSGPSYWRPRAPHLMGFNLPHYLYPESPFFTRLSPVSQRIRWTLRGWAMKYFARRDADAWVVQTDDVADRLRRWLNRDQVYTVHNTISRAYYEFNSAANFDSTISQTGPFRVLVLSMFSRHKNLPLIDEIATQLRVDNDTSIRFELTLPPEDFDRLIQPENRRLVINHGMQPPDKCPQLYRDCDILFLPTLLECFSANYVEAMFMRRPIVTTDLGFARTICRDAALYFTPMDAKEAVTQIRKLQKDSALYRELVSRGQRELPRFGTAPQRFQQFLAIMEKMVAAVE